MEEYAIKMSHGSVCLPTPGGRKDDLAVILPELARTGSLLKQRLGRRLLIYLLSNFVIYHLSYQSFQ